MRQPSLRFKHTTASIRKASSLIFAAGTTTCEFWINKISADFSKCHRKLPTHRLLLIYPAKVHLDTWGGIAQQLTWDYSL
ncbi:unnamed protein product [Larinioides sclopetarius]|uniref:Uncharacterized protein n=1 Tax=Larinioides sclopetarius TaxID=280406 RepID=A0AAV1ZV29_9ARAC